MSAPSSSRTSRPFGRLLVAAAAAFLLLLTAACSDSPEGNLVADGVEDDELPTQPAPTTTVPKECETLDPPVTAEDAPEVTVPEGEAPTALVTDDITEGEGPEVVAGDDVQVQYTGVKFSDGSEFDSSWDDLSPIDVTVGLGGVIQGWEEGLVGMRLGGRRQLVIPPDLAYGEATGEETDHELAGETLVFVVDLVGHCTPVAGDDTTDDDTDDGSDEGTTGDDGTETTVPDPAEDGRDDGGDGDTTTTEG